MSGIIVPKTSIPEKTYSSDGIKKLYGGNKPDIVVLGNSHALMWSRVLDEVANDLEVSISFFTADGTPVFFSIPPKKKDKGTLFFSAEEKYEFDVARLTSLEKWKPKVVVIVDNWFRKDKNITDDLVKYIGSIGSKILLIEQPPVLFFGDKNAPQYLSYLGLTKNSSKQYIKHASSGSYLKGIELVKEIAKECSYCIRLPISDLFLSDNQVLVIESDDVLYIDDDHLSYSGASKAKDRISSALSELIHR